MGGHTTRHNVRCSQTEVSCGFPCGKKLQCGNHVCTRICHSGPCYEDLPLSKKQKKKLAKANGGDGSAAQEISDFDRGISLFHSSSSSFLTFSSKEGEAEPLPTCGRLCLAKLSTCEHLCQAICHPGKPCHVTVCKQVVCFVSSTSSISFTSPFTSFIFSFTYLFFPFRSFLLLFPSTRILFINTLFQSKVRCACGRRTGEAVCNHAGDGVLTGNEAKPLPCDDACEVEIRNRKLAEALGVSFPLPFSPLSFLILSLANVFYH